jgi:hypothetical protein
MNTRFLQYFCMAVMILLAFDSEADPRGGPAPDWQTVVNNNDLMPPSGVRNFNSYNQPSINSNGMVVIRARSRGGPPLGPATHGLYIRDMSAPDSGIVRVLDRTTRVPQPNNLESLFVETPSFPRIDIRSSTIATRGNHKPVHQYRLGDGSETRAGTTGIYATPYGELITAAAKLGNIPEFSYLGVPEFNGITFEVFPGAPALSNSNTIVFKGNYSVDGRSSTGVYFRQLDAQPTGGSAPAILIANNTDTLIPGTTTVFGSTAPPSAARGKAVFAGFDNEYNPSLGGIYLAPLTYLPPLTTLVGIGQDVPGLSEDASYTDLGEAVAFDGRYVAFWGAWGDESRTARLYCKEEGNKDRIAYCNQRLTCEATGEVLGDPNSICDDDTDPFHGERCYTEKLVPANQGIFVHDTRSGETELVARNKGRFDEFLFWNYSGKAPCAGHHHVAEGGETDGESVRWRSTAFVAVAGGRGATHKVAFKAQTADGAAGIYLARKPGRSPIRTLLDTSMPGHVLDPEAPPGSTLIELGLEREGLRGNWLVVSAKMSAEGDDEEDDDMAGVYVTRLR